MLVKLTEKCSMGCSHCMNAAKATGRHMTEETLNDVLNFLYKNDLGNVMIISGGEPTEHPQFLDFMKKIIECGDAILHKTFMPVQVVITTNGFWILDHQEEAQDLVDLSHEGLSVMFQISTDARYYPKKLPTHKRIFREEGFTLCTDCVEWMYPQGRALENNLPYDAKSSKCFNVRSLANQLSNPSLTSIVAYLLTSGKVCTPHIKFNGEIGLGESDLCPVVGTIYESQEELIKKIQNFTCASCEFLNKTLPQQYKQLIRFTEEV